MGLMRKTGGGLLDAPGGLAGSSDCCCSCDCLVSDFAGEFDRCEEGYAVIHVTWTPPGGGCILKVEYYTGDPEDPTGWHHPGNFGEWDDLSDSGEEYLYFQPAGPITRRYRLRLYDINGKTCYSNEIEVTWEC